MNTTSLNVFLSMLLVILQLSCASSTDNAADKPVAATTSADTDINATTACQLALFSQYLNNLPKTDPTSVSKAIAYFRAHFSSCDPAIKDLAFVNIRDFYRAVHLKLHRHWHEEINDISIDNSKKSDTSNFHLYQQFAKVRELPPSTPIHPRIAPKLQALINNGFMIGIKEQRNTIAKNQKRLYQSLKKDLSPSLQTFLNKFVVESTKPLIDKAGKIAVPLTSIAERIVNWEKFAKTKPTFALKEDLQVYNQKNLELIMLGTMKTPAFNNKNNALNTLFKEAYQQIIKTHPQTNTGIVLQKYYQVLQQNNFVKSDESMAVIKEWKLL